MAKQETTLGNIFIGITFVLIIGILITGCIFAGVNIYETNKLIDKQKELNQTIIEIMGNESELHSTTQQVNQDSLIPMDNKESAQNYQLLLDNWDNLSKNIYIHQDEKCQDCVLNGECLEENPDCCNE